MHGVVELVYFVRRWRKDALEGWGVVNAGYLVRVLIVDNETREFKVMIVIVVVVFCGHGR